MVDIWIVIKKKIKFKESSIFLFNFFYENDKGIIIESVNRRYVSYVTTITDFRLFQNLKFKIIFYILFFCLWWHSPNIPWLPDYMDKEDYRSIIKVSTMCISGSLKFKWSIRHAVPSLDIWQKLRIESRVKIIPTVL